MILNTINLISYYKRDKYARRIFCGVYPLNLLPIRKVKNCSFIVNTHSSEKPGEHWFALFVPKRGPVEYFDSFGRKPQNKEIYDFIRVNGKKFIYNNKKIQGIFSDNCGVYTILYIYFRSRGYKLEDYKRFFTSNKEHNDLLIEKLYKKILK